MVSKGKTALYVDMRRAEPADRQRTFPQAYYPLPPSLVPSSHRTRALCVLRFISLSSFSPCPVRRRFSGPLPLVSSSSQPLPFPVYSVVRVGVVGVSAPATAPIIV